MRSKPDFETLFTNFSFNNIFFNSNCKALSKGVGRYTQTLTNEQTKNKYMSLEQ